MTKAKYCCYCGELLENFCECGLELGDAIKEYEGSPETHQGWTQQDVIDMYRRER